MSKPNKHTYTIHFDSQPKQPYKEDPEQERLNAARRRIERRREREALRREIDWYSK